MQNPIKTQVPKVALIKDYVRDQATKLKYTASRQREFLTPASARIHNS